VIIGSVINTGTCAIADALLTNSTLKCLWLGSNSIGNDGAVAFGLALEQNTTLECLLLPDNPIWQRGKAAIARTFQHSFQTTFISFDFSNVDEIIDREERLMYHCRKINKKDL
jgi:hypothetical protein